MEALSTKTLDAYVRTLPTSKQRSHFRNCVQQVIDLSDSGGELKVLLPKFAQLVANLFGASAVAFWFQVPGEPEQSDQPGLQRKVDVGWKNLALDAATQAAHQQLVEFAMRNPKPIAVKPFSAPAPRSNVSNPTDAFLLLLPLKFNKQDVSILEIALGPKPLRAPHTTLVESYLEWAAWLAYHIQHGIERSFAEVDEPLLQTLEVLQQTEQDIVALQDKIRRHIEASLQPLAGKNFGSIGANQIVTKRVHTMLDGKGLRVKCPECGAAAILRCQKAGNSKTGAFMFDHYLDSGRTFHGGQTTFPALTVVAKPPRRKNS